MSGAGRDDVREEEFGCALWVAALSVRGVASVSGVRVATMYCSGDGADIVVWLSPGHTQHQQ